MKIYGAAPRRIWQCVELLIVWQATRKTAKSVVLLIAALCLPKLILGVGEKAIRAGRKCEI
jgi:hypothetical protein